MALTDIVSQINNEVQAHPEIYGGKNYQQIRDLIIARGGKGVFDDFDNSERAEGIGTPERSAIERFISSTGTNVGNAYDAQGAKQAEDAKAQRQAEIDAEVNKRTQSGLAQKLDELYGNALNTGYGQIDQNAVAGRQKLVAEEAALGRLSSPASIVPISNYDAQTQRSKDALLGSISTAKAGGQLDIAKTIEGITQQNRGLAQNQNQFEQNLGLEKQKNLQDQQLGLQGLQQLDIQSQRAADAAKPGILDYVNTAVGGLGALGSLGSGLGAVGIGFNKKPKTAGVSN